MNEKSTLTISFGGLGLILTIVFLILKLCNQNNPDFAWLSWFWVFFPLWIPIASTIALFLVIMLITLIVGVVKNKK